MGEYSFEESAKPDDQKVKKGSSPEEISADEIIKKRFERKGSGNVRIQKIKLLDETGKEKKVFSMDEKMQVVLDYKMKQPCHIDVKFTILRMDYMVCYASSLKLDEGQYAVINGDGKLIIEFPNMELLPSMYMIDFKITNDKGEDVDIYNEAVNFQIYSSTKEAGMFRMQHKWKLNIENQMEEKK